MKETAVAVSRNIRHSRLQLIKAAACFYSA